MHKAWSIRARLFCLLKVHIRRDRVTTVTLYARNKKKILFADAFGKE